MKFRFSKKELDSYSAKEFIEKILIEREYNLNPYEHLAQKIKEVRNSMHNEITIHCSSCNKELKIQEIF